METESQRKDQFLVCVMCKKPMILHWYMRHVIKCVHDLPRAQELLSEASQRYNELLASRIKLPKKPLLLEIAAVQAETAATVQPEPEQSAPPAEEPEPVKAPIQPWVTKKQYAYGDVVEGKVEKLEHYGVFIYIGPNEKGLIHKSNIKNTLVTDVTHHFRIGDLVKAEVVDNSKNHKLGLSTKKFVVPNYHLSSAVKPKVGSYEANPLIQTPLGNPVLPETLKDIVVKHIEETKKESELEPVNKVEATDPNWIEALTYIKTKIGVVSPQALERFKEIMAKHGLFKFTVALAKATDDFQVDIGLILAREVETKLRDSL